MWKQYEFDRHDPVNIGYRRFKQQVRNLMVFLSMLMAILWFVGLPHIQYTYQPSGTKSSRPAHEKRSAQYWSVTGWQDVRAGKYASGCPAIVFIPLGDCLITDENRNHFPYRLLPRSKARSGNL